MVMQQYHGGLVLESYIGQQFSIETAMLYNGSRLIECMHCRLVEKMLELVIVDFSLAITSFNVLARCTSLSHVQSFCVE